MNLTKEEFKIMVMLYASNIDGNIHQSEIEAIQEKYDAATFKRVKRTFDNMNDAEVLELIDAYMKWQAQSETEKQDILDSVKSVIDADGYNSGIESYLFERIKKLIK